MKKKFLIGFNLLLVLAIVLAGCSKKTDTAASPASSTNPAAETAAPTAAPASNEPVEIKFVGMAGSVDGYTKRAEEFMKLHPNIKVKVQGIPANSWGELLQAISINIAAGDIPDIADIATEGQRAFAENGIIEPIDDLLARDEAEMKETLADIDPNLLNTLKINGKMYGLPTVWNNMVLYYNKKVLKEAGLEAPKPDWTIDDFIAMTSKVVAKNDGKNDKWGYAFGNAYFLTLVPWLYLNDGNVLTDDFSASKLEDPNSLGAFNTLHDFVYKYKISPKIDAGVSDFDLFVQNKLAFMGAGMWQVNALKLAKFSVDDYDVVNFPKMKSTTQVLGVGTAPIFKASKHKDAAWEFAKYLSSKQFQESFVVADGWSIPATKGAADKLLATEGFPKNGKIFYDSAATGKLVPAPREYGEVEAALTRAFGAAMANTMSMEEAMKGASKQINDAIAKNKK